MSVKERERERERERGSLKEPYSDINLARHIGVQVVSVSFQA